MEDWLLRDLRLLADDHRARASNAWARHVVALRRSAKRTPWARFFRRRAACFSDEAKLHHRHADAAQSAARHIEHLKREAEAR